MADTERTCVSISSLLQLLLYIEETQCDQVRESNFIFWAMEEFFLCPSTFSNCLGSKARLVLLPALLTFPQAESTPKVPQGSPCHSSFSGNIYFIPRGVPLTATAHRDQRAQCSCWLSSITPVESLIHHRRSQ